MLGGHSRGRVRDFRMNKEDAALLADCFNSFDDSDSWPGGFTGGTPYTADMILDHRSKSDDLRTMVASADDKIVGFCNLTPAENEPMAAYVQLLGVRPDYQGRGFGKALLLEALETATRLGKQRVYLHTWAGNLKAVPLYKRVGFKWVPSTRVVMESYIPGILNCPLFRDFFEKYYWYDALQPDITQSPDDTVRDGRGVYVYRFEGENGDRLEVIVDRYAKGVSAFELTMNGDTIAAEIAPEEQIGFIGLGHVPVRIRLFNGTGRKLNYSIEVDAEGHLKVDPVTPDAGEIAAGEETVLPTRYRVERNATHYDTDKPYYRVKTQAHWSITLGQHPVDLYAGVVPQDALSVSYAPPHVTAAPGQTVHVAMVLRNNTPDDIRGRVLLRERDSRESARVSPEMGVFEIPERGISALDINVSTTPEDANSAVVLTAVIEVESGGEIVAVKEVPLSIAVLGTAGAVAYHHLNKTTVLETETYRIVFAEGHEPAMRCIVFKPSGELLECWYSLLPGYPFPAEGGEWTNREFDCAVANHGNNAEVVYTAKSRERPGLVLTVRFRAHAGDGQLEVIAGLANEGKSRIVDLGMKAMGWLESRRPIMYVPLRGSIYRLASIEWSGGRYLPEQPDEYHEEWSACVDPDSGTVIGTIWQRKEAVKVQPRRGRILPDIEYRYPDLGPGESLERVFLRFVIGNGDWRVVRSVWATLNATGGPMVDVQQVRDDLEMEFVPVPEDESFSGKHREGRQRARPLGGRPPVILLDAAGPNTLEMVIQVVHRIPVTGTGKLVAPEGVLINGSREYDFEIESLSIEEPHRARLTLKVTDDHDRDWLRTGGEIHLHLSDRIVKIPLTAVICDSSVPLTEKKTEYEKATLYTSTAAGYGLSVCPEQVGSLVRYETPDGVGHFYDTFPEVRPYIWTDRRYSGLRPVAQAIGFWDWEPGFDRERWDIRRVECGTLAGFVLTSRLQHTPGARGLELMAEYLHLRGTPLLAVRIRAKNTTPEWKRVNVGLAGIVRVEGDPEQEVLMVRAGEPTTFHPTSEDKSFSVTPKAGWIVFRNPKSGRSLCAVTPMKNRSGIDVYHISRDVGDVLMLMGFVELAPGSHVTLHWYLFETMNSETVQSLKDLPQLPELDLS